MTNRENYQSYHLLGEGLRESNDSYATKHNCNTLIVGGSGSGKSRNYCLPNLLSIDTESVIVSDTKHTLYSQTKEHFEAKGYKVWYIDTTDFTGSDGYNPLDYVHTPEEIHTLATQLCPIETDEPFWDYAARNLIETCIAYNLEAMPASQHNLFEVQKLINRYADGTLNTLMQELEVLSPESNAVQKYNALKGQAPAEKMVGSIIGIAVEKLTGYLLPSMKKMYTAKNRINFAEIGRSKNAVFFCTSDTDTSNAKDTYMFTNETYYSPMILVDTSAGTQSFRLNELMLKNRELEIRGPITDTLAYELCQQLRYLSKTDPEADISIFIDSPGGSVSAGFMILDMLKMVPNKIKTYNMGTCASFAALILAAGNERYVMPSSTTMVHQPYIAGNGVVGKLDDINRVSRNLAKDNKRINDILAEYTGKTAQQIRNSMRKGDVNMTAEQAISYGLADHVMTNIA